jgi:O-antigen/teichoic acid export membrane protein
MDDAFSQALADWTAFYALMGVAAATLLGLLFVAVSVRLNIFHQREVADVRDFAAFTFGTFLVAIAVAGFAIAPHAHRFTLALSLLLVSLAAFVAIAGIATKAALEHSGNRCRSGYAPDDWRGWA